MSHVKLRNITLDDVDIIFKWRQDKNIRKYSRIIEEPTYEAHVNWMKNRLTLVNGFYGMVVYGDISVGVVRLDLLSGMDANAYEVSIFIDKDYQQKGIALDCLNMIRMKYPEYNLYAYIDDKNIASKRLFAKAGYQPSNGWYLNKLVCDIANDE